MKVKDYLSTLKRVVITCRAEDTVETAATLLVTNQIGAMPVRDANGHRIFKAERTKVTIQDVIAMEGPRTPDVYHSQRTFNTGFVMVVEHGKKPSQELIDRVNGIREQWLQYWPITTGHRSTMTANPQ